MAKSLGGEIRADRHFRLCLGRPKTRRVFGMLACYVLLVRVLRGLPTSGVTEFPNVPVEASIEVSGQSLGSYRLITVGQRWDALSPIPADIQRFIRPVFMSESSLTGPFVDTVVHLPVLPSGPSQAGDGPTRPLHDPHPGPGQAVSPTPSPPSQRNAKHHPTKIDTPKTGGRHPQNGGLSAQKHPIEKPRFPRISRLRTLPARPTSKTRESRFDPLESPHRPVDVIRRGCHETRSASKTVRHPQSSARPIGAHFRKSSESGFPPLYHVTGSTAAHHAMAPIPKIPESWNPDTDDPRPLIGHA